MAVFLAASDEASGEGIFHHAGFVAPLVAWTDVIVPAWERMVLKGPPLLEEFHMTDLRSRAWREKHGITQDDAEARIDAAVNIIWQTQGILALRSSVDGTHFEDQAYGLKFRLNDPFRKPVNFVVDYPSFHGYLYLVLTTLAAYPNTEKIDFVVETKDAVFPAMREFHKGLGEAFRNIGLPHFADIIGEFIPGDKKRISLQAADLLCWHTQRAAANARNPSKITFSDIDRERLTKMTRFGIGQTWPRQMMDELCGGLFDDWRKLNEVEGISGVRPDDKNYSSGGPKSSESCDGEGEGN